MFLHVSVCSQEGSASSREGVCLQQERGLPTAGRGLPTERCLRTEEVSLHRDSAYGGGLPTEGVWSDAHPPELEERVVCILLECFLIFCNCALNTRVTNVSGHQVELPLCH